MGKKISEMPPAEQEAQREKWREAKRNSRKDTAQQELFPEPNKKPVKKELTEEEKKEREKKTKREWYQRNKERLASKHAKYQSDKIKKKDDDFLNYFNKLYG